MTPGLPLYFHNTLSTVLSVSLHRSHQKNSNKRPGLRVGWEWTAQRQTNLSLLWYLLASTLTVFLHAHTLHTLPPSLLSPLSKKHSCFLTPLIDFRFSSISPGGIVRRIAPHVLKKEKKEKKRKDSLWAFSALTFSQLWARQPGSETRCRAPLKGQFHRTIAHITPNPSDTQGNAWVAMTRSGRLWIMKANAEAKPSTRLRNIRCIWFLKIVRGGILQTRSII